MKVLQLLIISATLALAPTIARSCPDGYLVIDLEESLFLGKEIGQEYQCGEWLDYHRVKLYDRTAPDSYIIIDTKDPRYKLHERVTVNSER